MLRIFLRFILTIWLALSATFLALRLFAVDAISAQYAQAGLSQAEAQERRAALGLDDPLWAQYVNTWVGVMRGDLGRSLYSPLTVTELLILRLPSSLGLALGALVVALPLGLGLGILAAYKPWAWLRGWLTLALALPIYWTGTLMVVGVGAWLGGINRNPWMPLVVLAFHMSAGLAQAVRARAATLRTEPFVLSARARGLSERALWRRHLLPHLGLAVLPILTPQFGLLLGGTVITESLFLRPGMGTLLVDAVLQRDWPIVQGGVLVVALLMGLCQLVSEGLQRLLDPRLRAL